jgi:hypothetical protein
MAQKIALAAVLTAQDTPPGAQLATIDVDLRSDPNAGGFFNALVQASLIGAIAPPGAPTLATAVSGALPAHNAHVVMTFVDANGGESLPSAEASQAVAANSVLTAASPAAPGANPAANAAAVGYNVYATDGAAGTETRQNVAPIAIGTGWQEPNTGLTTTGASAPTVDTTGFAPGPVTITISQP